MNIRVVFAFPALLILVIVLLAGCSVEPRHAASNSIDGSYRLNEEKERHASEILNEQLMDENSLINRGLDSRRTNPNVYIERWPTVFIDKQKDK